MIEVVLLGALVVAFVNGANDNFKGVATLYGSGLLSYRRALALGPAATAVGGVAGVRDGVGHAAASGSAGKARAGSAFEQSRKTAASRAASRVDGGSGQLLDIDA